MYPGKNVLRWLIVVVSPQMPGFDTWAVYVRFIVEKLAYERFSSKIFGFPCQCHSTNVPWKYFIHLLSSICNPRN